MFRGAGKSLSGSFLCVAHLGVHPHVRAIHTPVNSGQTGRGWMMSESGVGTEQRRGVRTKAVLPVRVKGKDSSGKPFEELAHTLDVAPAGVRLGSIHHELSAPDEITLFFRQRKMIFRVVWTKKMNGTSEFQVGLRAVTQDREAWGLGLAQYRSEPTVRASHASGVA
jgi:hypothetical protein